MESKHSSICTFRLRKNYLQISFFHHEILPEICEWLSPFSFQEPKRLKAQEVQNSSSSQWIQWEWRVLQFITRLGCRGSAGSAVINRFQTWLCKWLPTEFGMSLQDLDGAVFGCCRLLKTSLEKPIPHRWWSVCLWVWHGCAAVDPDEKTTA